MRNSVDEVKRFLLTELSSIEQEYQQLKSNYEKFIEIEDIRNKLLKAYEAVDWTISGDARERREKIEKLMETYKIHFPQENYNAVGTETQHRIEPIV